MHEGGEAKSSPVSINGRSFIGMQPTDRAPKLEYEDVENPLIIHLHEAHGRAQEIGYFRSSASVVHVPPPRADAKFGACSFDPLGHTGPLIGAPDVRAPPGPFKRNSATIIPR